MASDSLQPKKLGSYLIILGVALIFVLQFGPGGGNACNAPLSKSNADLAAEVNAHDITAREFRSSYGRILEQQHIPEELAQRLGLARQVLDQLVDEELLEQAAERKGITASDADVRDVLYQIPSFQVDGKFDFAQYNNVVRENYGQTVPFFETRLRREISARRLMSMVEGTAYVSDDEVHKSFLKSGNKANVTLVRFVPAMFADKVAKPSAQALKDFEAREGKRIDAYYQENRATYRQGERVHARHILVKVERDAKPEQKEAARKKAEALRQEILSGKDFAQVARESSDDPGSKAEGGDLGTQERSAWVPEFANAAFALKPKEISEPVSSPFGYHLIQVLEKKPAEDRSLDQVRDEIAATLIKRDESQKLARAAAEKALADLKAGKPLAKQFPKSKDDATSRFAASLKPEAVETGEFPISGDTVPTVGMAPELAKDISRAEGPMVLARVYEPSQTFVVAEVTERKHPTEAEFAAQKDKLRKEALDARRTEVGESFRKALRKEATVKVNDALVGPKLEQS